MKKSKLMNILLLLILINFLFVNIAFATDFNPIVKGEQWFKDNAEAAFRIVIIGVAIFLLVKRQFAAFVGFALFAFLVAVFVFYPDIVKDVGAGFGKFIMGK